MSPEFYLLGPVKFYEGGSNKVVFQEQRQWEIASDDVGTEWFYQPTANQPWNGYGWQKRQKITINSSKVVGAQLDNDESSEIASNSSTMSFLYTTGSQSNRILIVGVSTETSANNWKVNSVRYGNQALTLEKDEYENPGVDDNQKLDDEMWYLLNPPSGTAAVYINTAAYPSSDQWSAGAATYYNVTQSAPTGLQFAGNANTTPATVTVSGIAAGDLVVDVLGNADDTTPDCEASATPASGQLVVWNQNNTDSGCVPATGAEIINAESMVTATSTSQVMSWAVTATSAEPIWGEIAVALVPVSTTASAAYLANFPVLVSSTDTNLNSNTTQASGADILFTDSTGENLLPFELESYNQATGAIVAWVNVATLSATQNTNIYMYYDNPAASSLANAPNVWDSHYVGVWHLGPTATGGTSYPDSTSNGNNCTTIGSGVTKGASALFGTGATLNGTSNGLITCTSSASLNISGSNITLEAWVDPSAIQATSAYANILEKGNSSSFAYELENYNQSGNNEIATDLFNANNTDIYGLGSTNIGTGTWYQLVSGTTGSGQDFLINDGNYDADGGGLPWDTTYGFRTNGTVLTIGYDGHSAFTGTVEELRISNIARSQGWISTEYNNYSSPSSFYTLSGTVETDAYAPTLGQLLRHGEFFGTQGSESGVRQPFTW